MTHWDPTLVSQKQLGDSATLVIRKWSVAQQRPRRPFSVTLRVGSSVTRIEWARDKREAEMYADEIERNYALEMALRAGI